MSCNQKYLVITSLRCNFYDKVQIIHFDKEFKILVVFMDVEQLLQSTALVLSCPLRFKLTCQFACSILSNNAAPNSTSSILQVIKFARNQVFVFYFNCSSSPTRCSLHNSFNSRSVLSATHCHRFDTMLKQNPM